MVEGRPYFTRSPQGKKLTGRRLMPGGYQRKLGDRVVKGRWKGFPIFALTLEERTTCPRDCEIYNACYGNKMHWSVRHKAGTQLMDDLLHELVDLQARYPRGFVLRLHVLGDFFSTEYVEFWRRCLHAFPALHVFGYTARWNDDIGLCLWHVIRDHWPRFAIRSSGAKMAGIPASIVIADEDERGDAIVCPAQTDRTSACGTCSLCWATRRDIAFLAH